MTHNCVKEAPLYLNMKQVALCEQAQSTYGRRKETCRANSRSSPIPSGALVLLCSSWEGKKSKVWREALIKCQRQKKLLSLALVLELLSVPFQENQKKIKNLSGLLNVVILLQLDGSHQGAFESAVFLHQLLNIYSSVHLMLRAHDFPPFSESVQTYLCRLPPLHHTLLKWVLPLFLPHLLWPLWFWKSLFLRI